MFLNTKPKDQTQPGMDWYPGVVLSERITPAVIAAHLAKARRLRTQATAEIVGKGITAVGNGLFALLWPLAFRKENREPGSRDS